MKGRLLLDVVVRQRTPVLELLAREDETLLVRGNALLVLDLRLDIIDRIRGLDLERDGLAGQSLNEDLHATTETKDEMEGGLLLDVVVGQGTTVLQLLAGEDEALLVGRDAFLVLDLGLHVVNSVRRLHLKRDRLAREGLDEDLHAATETEDKVQSGLLLDVVVRKGAAILKLLASEDQALLVGRDAVCGSV